MKQDILKLSDLAPETLLPLLEQAVAIKAEPEKYRGRLAGKSLLLLFEKTSTRTSVSYQVAINQLGGYAVVLDWDRSNFTLSPVCYEGRYLSTTCDAIVARLKKNSTLLELAQASLVSVINGCDDRHHPSQALADYMTILEVAGTLEGVRLCYVGVRNNVSNSLAEGALALGVRLTLVTPSPVSAPGGPGSAALDPELDARIAASDGQVRYVSTREELEEAVASADFLYTDTWVDMEFFSDPAYAREKEQRVALMLPYQLNRELLQKCGSSAWIMHDMPVHPGYEIAAELVEGERSLIYQQAENRLHAQKALLLHLLGF